MSYSMVIPSTFGIYPPDKHPFGFSEKVAIVHNILNVCDSILIISRISGLARLILAAIAIIAMARSETEVENYKKLWVVAEISRGITSVLGFGFLFTVPDLLSTIQYHFDRHETTFFGFDIDRI